MEGEELQNQGDIGVSDVDTKNKPSEGGDAAPAELESLRAKVAKLEELQNKLEETERKLTSPEYLSFLESQNKPKEEPADEGGEAWSDEELESMPRSKFANAILDEVEGIVSRALEQHLKPVEETKKTVEQQQMQAAMWRERDELASTPGCEDFKGAVVDNDPEYKEFQQRLVATSQEFPYVPSPKLIYYATLGKMVVESRAASANRRKGAAAASETPLGEMPPDLGKSERSVEESIKMAADRSGLTSMLKKGASE